MESPVFMPPTPKDSEPSTITPHEDERYRYTAPARYARTFESLEELMKASPTTLQTWNPSPAGAESLNSPFTGHRSKYVAENQSIAWARFDAWRAHLAVEGVQALNFDGWGLHLIAGSATGGTANEHRFVERMFYMPEYRYLFARIKDCLAMRNHGGWDYKGVILMGDPGIGKTHFLHLYLMLALARGQSLFFYEKRQLFYFDAHRTYEIKAKFIPSVLCELEFAGKLLLADVDEELPDFLSMAISFRPLIVATSGQRSTAKLVHKQGMARLVMDIPTGDTVLTWAQIAAQWHLDTRYADRLSRLDREQRQMVALGLEKFMEDAMGAVGFCPRLLLPQLETFVDFLEVQLPPLDAELLFLDEGTWTTRLNKLRKDACIGLERTIQGEVDAIGRPSAKVLLQAARAHGHGIDGTTLFSDTLIASLRDQGWRDGHNDRLKYELRSLMVSKILVRSHVG
ncbi:hypothetical protein MKEN_00513400 [Mycena kentingensis (nom. inval.)]|nr:hypothetical protein MKEN_00513400 [Mycena kentingensis (nom. inval.)]